VSREADMIWAAAGLMDIQIGYFMKPEVGHAEMTVQPGVQNRGGQAGQGTRGIGSAGWPGPRRS
jgi:hypothetical protein